MKKYIRYADVFVLFTGAVGLLLRLIMALGGTDEKELYPANHPAWVILCVMSVLVIAAIFFLTRKVGAEESYDKNFPASLPGAIGCGLAAIGLLVSAIGTLQADWLCVVGALFGVAGAVGLAVAAYCRYVGKKPHFGCFAALCGFFAVRAFLLGRVLGAEPEACRYLFEILASLAMVPACYQLWGFTVDMGSRQKCLFWSLTAAFLCIVGIFSQDSWLLYLTAAAFLLSNLCPLQHMPRRLRTAEQTEELPDAGVETAPAEATTADPVDQIDPDAILAEILKEIDQTVE